MGDVRELGQDGMSRLPWIPWDTSCFPSSPTPPRLPLRSGSQPLSVTSGTMLSDPNMWKEAEKVKIMVFKKVFHCLYEGKCFYSLTGITQNQSCTYLLTPPPSYDICSYCSKMKTLKKSYDTVYALTVCNNCNY